ncbi:serine hydrolase [Streptomyces sp. NPDC002530]
MSPRRMEEASVAGESPDKSEQRKSSGTTRSEADPRLAVFHEPASPAETGEREDTATAVFRTPSREELDGREESGGSGERGGSGEPGGSEESDAVGAADGSARADGSGDGVKGSEGSAGADDAVDGAGGDEGAAEAAEGSEGAAKGSETEKPEPLEGSEQPERREDGDARLRAAVAAWVSTDADADGEARAEAAEAGDPDAAAAQAADAVAKNADADTDTRAGDAGADTDADQAVKPAAKAPEAEEKAEPADAPEADAERAAQADAAAGTKTELKPDAKPDANPKPKPKPDAKPEAGTAPAPKAEPEAGTGSEAGSEAGAGPDAETGPGPRVPRTREETPEKAADRAPEKQAEKTAGQTPEKAPAGDTTGIDQATAVFKTPRLPRVDQPTTALKITPPPAKAAGAGEQAEPAAERTSRFVPLRSDDVRPAPAPAPRTPEAPAPAPGGAGQQPPAASLSGAERTRQQPMPPRPPLDLLAELTNTPPPPDTPVRTAVRRVKIWTPLVLLLLLVFAIVQMVRPLPDPVLTMTAESSYTFKGGDLKLSWPEQGQSAVTVDGVGTMGSSGAQKPAPIASVAKIMTAYVVLKDHPLTGKEEGEQITVDQQAEDESKLGDESTAPISKGQQFSEKELLQLLMIPSGNNAARLFARWDSSETEFVAKMNAAAKELGMTRTTYTDPSGLKKTTVSTAEDQLKLAKAVMRNDVFREIVDTPQIKIDGIDTTIYNNNTILLEPGVSGIKTGSSTPAGGNLVWSANTVVDGKKLWIYGAVMGQQAGTGQPYDSLVMSLNNSLKLIKGAQKAVVSAEVVKKGDVVGYVDDGFGGRTPLVATAGLKAKGWQGLKVELSVTDDGKGISRSMKAGTKVGVVTVGTGTGRVSAPVALQQDMKDPTFGQKLSRLG